MRRKTLSLMMVGILSLNSSVALAQSSTSSSTSSANSSSVTSINRTLVRSRLKELRENQIATQTERQQKIADMRKLAAAERCEKITTNIQARIDFYKEHQDKYNTYFNRVAENLDKAITRLKALGYDTSGIDKKVTILKEQLINLRAEYAKLVAALTTAQAQACASEPAAAIKSLRESQKNLLEIRKQVAKIKTSIRVEIATAIREMKAKKQVRSSSTSSKSTSNSSSTQN